MRTDELPNSELPDTGQRYDAGPDPDRRGRSRLRWRHAIALILAGATVLGVIAGASIGLLEGSVAGMDGLFSERRSARPGAASSVPSAAPKAPVAAKPKPGVGVPPVTGRDFGFVTGTYTKGTTRYLRFDRAVYLTGEAANAASAARGGDTPAPDGYFIQNDNRLIRDVAVRADAVAIGSIQLTGKKEPTPVTLSRLYAFLGKRTAGSSGPPFHLTYGPGGVVTRISEQYLP